MPIEFDLNLFSLFLDEPSLIDEAFENFKSSFINPINPVNDSDYVNYFSSGDNSKLIPEVLSKFFTSSALFNNQENINQITIFIKKLPVDLQNKIFKLPNLPATLTLNETSSSVPFQQTVQNNLLNLPQESRKKRNHFFLEIISESSEYKDLLRNPAEAALNGFISISPQRNNFDPIPDSIDDLLKKNSEFADFLDRFIVFIADETLQLSIQTMISALRDDLNLENISENLIPPILFELHPNLNLELLDTEINRNKPLSNLETTSLEQLNLTGDIIEDKTWGGKISRYCQSLDFQSYLLECKISIENYLEDFAILEKAGSIQIWINQEGINLKNSPDKINIFFLEGHMICRVVLVNPS